MKKYVSTILAMTLSLCAVAQKPAGKPLTDSNTPLHLLQPDYNVPYGVPGADKVKGDIDRILKYIDANTPAKINKQGRVEQGTFRLNSYEWGVTYSGVLNAAKATGDNTYLDYAKSRMSFMASNLNLYRQFQKPGALDDCGAITAAMIKASLDDPELAKALKPVMDNCMDYIMNKEYRLSDGTFARTRPLKNSVWLDDIFMGVPALAWYGKFTGDEKYINEAARQILLFKKHMWLPEKNLFRHGWVESMDEHPSFHWARANGWAILAMAEVLDVLPENHPERAEILKLFQDHAKGLCALQSGEGFWHQLVDRNDSYLETSATAIYAYCLAHGINKGWLNVLAYGPAAVLAWNAVSTKITSEGLVEGTCVGTGMAFDPAFYYYRPVSAYAAHGYGPVLLAGSELIALFKNYYPRLNDSAVQFYTTDHSKEGAIFHEN